MRSLIVFLLCCIAATAFAQLAFDEQQFFARLQPGSSMPEKLLSTRTVVFHPYNMTTKELEAAQKSFQRTGIDAILYFENDLLAAGRDVSVALAAYLNKREISNIVIFQKTKSAYTIHITAYNRKANLVEQNQPSWVFESKALDVLLQEVYRTAANSIKNENFLINDVPEIGLDVSPIDGRRAEFFAIDLKVDPLAIPKFGDPEMDTKLEEIMKLFPFKYKLTEAGLSESELRKQGYLYVLRFVHCRNKVAKNLMGYDMGKSNSAIVSVFFEENESRLKNISSNDLVYKFYFKHIDSGNVFLGTKWDADTSWEQALINQLKGFKTEFKIN